MKIELSHLILFAFVVSWAGACSSSAAGELGVPEFPTQARIDSLTTGQADEFEGPPRGIAVDQWTLLGPLPDRIEDGPLPADSPLDELTASSIRLSPSQALSCTARELAYFHEREGGQPERALFDFMARRCGWFGSNIGWIRQSWSPGADTPDLGALVTKQVGAGFTGKLGLWQATKGDVHTAVVVFGQQSAILEPLSMLPDRGVVELTGEIGPHQWVRGFVTQGHYDASECRNMPAAKHRFRLLCSVDESDRGATVEVTCAKPGRVFGETKIRAWVSPDRTLSKTFVEPRLYKTPAPISPSSDLDVVMYRSINDLRNGMKRPPLRMATEQSAEFDRIHPFFSAAAQSGRSKIVDSLGLGLLAGWKLPGRVLGGDIGVFVLDSVADRGDILRAALMSPHMRYVLLDADREVLALSIVGAASATREVMLGTWVPSPAGHQAQAEHDFVQLVKSVRRDAGLPKTARVGGELHGVLARHGASMSAGVSTPQQALTDAHAEVSSLASMAVETYMFSTQDIATVEIPPELLGDQALQMVVHVEVFSNPSSNWSTLVVMVSYVY